MATSTFSHRSISLAAAPTSASAPSRSASAFAPPRRSPSLRFSSKRLAAGPLPIALRRIRVPRAGSDHEVSNLEDDGQLGDDLSGDTVCGSLSMQSLIQSYKEAIISDDEKGITKLEAAICKIEREKNELLDKVSGTKAEIASGKDKLLRLTADFENFRRRSDKDRLSFTSDIQSEMIESLLPLVDNFETAKQQVVAETEKEKKIVTSYQGIYKQFVETMRALRVSVVETVGKQFDPSVHEAVARVDSHKFREGTILQEVQRGFFLGDRILRPAKVKVSNGPSKSASLSGENSGENPAEESSQVSESVNEEIPVAEGS